MERPAERRPHVMLITTGGTIACTSDPHAGCTPGIDPGELLRSAGVSAAGAGIELRPYRNVLGTALVPEDLFAIARAALEALARPEVDGVVVTAGTGIIEEGSYLCELLNPHDKPIVWTGAQLGADRRDGDGPGNLRAALRVAASPGARASGAGALVCFNDEVFPARDAIKVHKTSRAAFTSLDHGLLGRVDDGEVVWRRRVAGRRWFAVDRLETRVDLIKLVSGSDARFFQASVASGARGIVVEGFPGTGMVSPGASNGIRAAREAGVTVVLSSRAPMGRTLPRYGTELGAATLVRSGVLLGGDLAPAKLRLLLMVVLAVTGAERDVAELVRAATC